MASYGGDDKRLKWLFQNATGGFHVWTTTEKVIGEWVNGKPVYEITINAGAMPNNQTKIVQAPANVELVIDFSGFCTDGNGNVRPLPMAGGGTNDVRLDLTAGDVRVVTFADWSAYDAWIVIRYTKSTD